MRYTVYIFACCIGILVLQACQKSEEENNVSYNEWLSGGSQTVFTEGAGAFGSMFPVLSDDKAEVHEAGDAAFEATFVSAPSPKNPGLGPVFNSVSCAACHVADGRGKPPGAGEQMISMLIRSSIPGTDEHGGPNPAPGFGGQLQQRAIAGTQPEVGIEISYNNQTYQFADNSTYELRHPTYTLVNPYTAIPAGMMISPRVAPPVFGLGLLEAIPDDVILSYADEHDADGDGISGKPNYTWDILKGKLVIGRFGWKAAQPTILQQAAGAYNEDMGITNFLFPQESVTGQSQYNQVKDYGVKEVSDSLLYAVAFYMKTLAVPARRNANNPVVLRGKEVFAQANCVACHIPKMKTAVNVAFPELSNQTIFPYTDLLLHDMGPDLADNRPDFYANGQEWRTSPLWGIGLTQIVNGHNNFLHDGRARTLLEAVMFHGGEAEASKLYVKNLPKVDRDALVKFLESL